MSKAKSYITGNLIFLSILLLIISGCTSVDQKAEREKLMEVSRQWAKSQSVDEYLNYWSDDAIFIEPGMSLRGHDQIRKMLEGATQIPGFQVDWEPQEARISKSGDLGYLIENLSFSWNDSLGNKVQSFNKAVTIWEKQEDGTWKNVVDIHCEDPSVTSVR